jgi:alpha-N-arabinofuranosidase
VVRSREIVEEVNGRRHKIGLALDEWGVWHPEARTWGPEAAQTGGTEFEQANTLAGCRCGGGGA